MIHRQIVIILLLLLAFNVLAQNDYKDMASVEILKAMLANESATANTIECDFTQTKHIDMLSENMVSKGKFYFKKENKICLDYSVPLKYLVVINKQKIKIVADGKTNIYDVKRNKMMNEMNILLTACMTGNLNSLSSAYVLYYKENTTSYWINVRPKNDVKTDIQQVDIYLDKKDLSVQCLKLTEASADFTEYVFTEAKKNGRIPDEKFSLR